MALTPNIRATQGRTLGAVESETTGRVTQARVLAAISFPTEEERVTQARLMGTVLSEPDLRVTQARVLAAVRGRTANPVLRAWTFSLDGHDFYVLRLGEFGTLVYDLYSEQWMEWGDLDKVIWRANIGINWTGGTALADTYGSNAIVGDDVHGLIWFLDPEQPYDEHPDYLNPTQEVYFDRVIMGQLPIRGREVLPCYSVWITADMGDPAYFGAGVTLYTSDDGGENFDDHGLVSVRGFMPSPCGCRGRTGGSASSDPEARD